MDRKTIAIIFLAIGFGLATAFWLYPPFGQFIYAGLLWLGNETLSFTALNWIGMIVGGLIVSGVWAIKKWDMTRSIRNVANRRKEEYKAGLQTSPTITQPVGVGVGAVSTPLLEEKRIV